MSLQKLISGYVRYNYWANERLSEWLMGLNPELLDAQTASSFPSVALTLRHIQESQEYWLRIIAGKKMGGAPEIGFEGLLKSSEMMEEVYGAYSEAALLEKVASTDLVRPRYEFILHSVNHGSYHRGQVVTMCRRLGVTGNIPTTDYDAFLWVC